MVEINNLTTNIIDEDFLKKVAKVVLKSEGKEKSGLSIALIGQGRMRKLNKRYRGKNRVTDVLAFSQESRVKSQEFPIPPGIGLGEIVICVREVKKNAKRFGSVFEKELATCLIHGILHLLGYGHEISEEKAKEMEKKQQYYLSRVT